MEACCSGSAMGMTPTRNLRQSPSSFSEYEVEAQAKKSEILFSAEGSETVTSGSMSNGSGQAWQLLVANGLLRRGNRHQHGGGGAPEEKPKT